MNLVSFHFYNFSTFLNILGFKHGTIENQLVRHIYITP